MHETLHTLWIVTWIVLGGYFLYLDTFLDIYTFGYVIILLYISWMFITKYLCYAMCYDYFFIHMMIGFIFTLLPL